MVRKSVARFRLVRTCTAACKFGQHGFTLLEVSIMLLILGVAFLLMSGVQVTAIQSNSRGFESSVAVALAETELQLLETKTFLDPDLAAGAHDDGTLKPHAVTYALSYTVTDNDPIVGMKLINYAVSWNGGTRSINLVTRMGS
jgi:prepilin-type N-terminal cleavage/methylation domain-containing protein